MSRPVAEFDADPFKWRVRFHTDRASYARDVDHEDVTEEDLERYGGYCTSYKLKRICYIGVFVKDYTAILCHEAIHAGIDIFDASGARVDPDNQEPFTYFVEEIFWKCEQAIKKGRKKRSTQQSHRR